MYLVIGNWLKCFFPVICHHSFSLHPPLPAPQPAALPSIHLSLSLTSDNPNSRISRGDAQEAEAFLTTFLRGEKKGGQTVCAHEWKKDWLEGFSHKLTQKHERWVKHTQRQWRQLDRTHLSLTQQSNPSANQEQAATGDSYWFEALQVSFRVIKCQESQF